MKQQKEGDEHGVQELEQAEKKSVKYTILGVIKFKYVFSDRPRLLISKNS